MRVNVAIPEPHVSAPVLDAALEAVTRLDESMIRRGELEPFDPERPQARWKPEPPGQEHFDHGLMVLGRGWGDCDDLAPWRAASLRATREDPGARAIVRRSGPRRWHALVRRSDGSIDDPSLDAGMPGKGARRGVQGAAQPLMLLGSSVVGTYLARPQLAIRPVAEPGGHIESWQARTDLPWHTRRGTSPGDIAMVSLHRSPRTDQSLVGAIEGAILLGETSDAADEEHLERLRCLSDMVQGCSWEECAREYGPHHATAAGSVVGKLFKGKFFRKLGKTFKPLARVVKPLASAALPLAAPALSAALKLPPGATQAVSPALSSLLKKERHLPPQARGAAGPVTINIYTGRRSPPGVAAVER